MPESWEDDTERRKKAGIPDHIRHSTKPEMALKMILEQRKKGTHFDFVSFDALYGSSLVIVSSLVANGIFFLGDIKENMHVFLEEPSFGFPTPIKGKRGRKRKHPKTDSASISVRDLKAGLKDEDWTSLTFRSGTKKPIKAMFYSRKVWIYVDSKTIPLILLVRKDPDGKTKYSFTNMDDISLLELAQRQASGYLWKRFLRRGKTRSDWEIIR